MKNYIESKDNKIFKYILKLMNSKTFRKKQSEFVVEGARLCNDALISGAEIKILVYTKQAFEKYKNIVSELEKNSNNVYVFSENLFSCVSDTKSPQGILCVCAFLDKQISIDKIGNNDRIVVFENIQDPSNLGTMLRTAEALGINNVILSDDCCDIYNPKVLRGSMGAVFRLSFCTSENLAATITALNNLGFKTYAAVPDSAAEKVTSLDFNNKSVVVIGNEGNGLKQETVVSCFKPITIPMAGKAESLNAAMAASILMWEVVRGGS